jgi:hypothetical protein
MYVLVLQVRLKKDTGDVMRPLSVDVFDQRFDFNG